MKKITKKSFIAFMLLNSVLASDALISLGERLFNDGRFSRHFWQHSNGNVNHELSNGEKHLEKLLLANGLEVDSPFKGTTQSCASCHMVDQAFGSINDPGMRTYTDFSKRIKIPKRNDNKTHAARNTPSLVGIGSAYNRNRFSHWDGEFHDHFQTVLGNMTGRNMGWLSHEKEIARKNIIKVIREDDGSVQGGDEFGGSYKEVLLSKNVEDEFKLEPSERVDISKADDQQVINAVINAVSAYMNDLDFEKDDKGQYVGSPFDQFLIQNGFSTIPKKDESNEQFTERLKNFLSGLNKPKFIEKKHFPTHHKDFSFGKVELEGAKVFFNIDNSTRNQGSCFKCHQAPLYTDNSFHNIGTSQMEYDMIHGEGSFKRLSIPSLETRRNKFFNNAPKENNLQSFDLGVWNFYKRNKKVTDFIETEVCTKNMKCDLSQMVARFKTPSLRDLSHSAPYFHNGLFDDLEDSISVYMFMSRKAKMGEMRNADPILKEMRLNMMGVRVLSSFLKSLNENYE